MLQLCRLNLCALHWSSRVEPKYRLPPLNSQDAACRYEGSWVKGVREGQGKCKYANGDVYDGEWSADVRAGAGSCNYENGDKYTGAQLAEDTLLQRRTSPALDVGRWPEPVSET